jgi:hypothetical protein
MLRALANAGAPVPAVEAEYENVLLLGFVENDGVFSARAWADLGHRLAELHRPVPSAYGWPVDYAIGTVAFDNRETSDWPLFWGEQRLVAAASVLDRPWRERVERLAPSPRSPAGKPAGRFASRRPVVGQHPGPRRGGGRLHRPGLLSWRRRGRPRDARAVLKPARFVPRGLRTARAGVAGAAPALPAFPGFGARAPVGRRLSCHGRSPADRIWGLTRVSLFRYLPKYLINRGPSPCCLFSSPPRFQPPPRPVAGSPGSGARGSAQGNDAFRGVAERARRSDHTRFRADRPRRQQPARGQGRALPAARRGAGGRRSLDRPDRQARDARKPRGGRRRQQGDHRRLCRRRPRLGEGAPGRDRRPLHLGGGAQRGRPGRARRGAAAGRDMRPRADLRGRASDRPDHPRAIAVQSGQRQDPAAGAGRPRPAEGGSERRHGRNGSGADAFVRAAGAALSDRHDGL